MSDKVENSWKKKATLLWKSLNRCPDNAVVATTDNGAKIDVGYVKDVLVQALAASGEPLPGLDPVSAASPVVDTIRNGLSKHDTAYSNEPLTRLEQILDSLSTDGWSIPDKYKFPPYAPVAVIMPFRVWEALCHLKNDGPRLILFARRLRDAFAAATKIGT